jgi:hypothetical protein
MGPDSGNGRRRASDTPLNERRFALLLCVVEASWLAGIGYVLSLIA